MSSPVWIRRRRNLRGRVKPTRPVRVVTVVHVDTIFGRATFGPYARRMWEPGRDPMTDVREAVRRFPTADRPAAAPALSPPDA